MGLLEVASKGRGTERCQIDPWTFWGLSGGKSGML